VRRTDEREVYRQTTRGALYNFGGKNIGFVLNFFFTIIIARYLGPSDYGNYSFYRNAASLLALFAILGLDNTMNRFVPRLAKKGGGHTLHCIEQQAMRVSIWGLVGVTIATIFLFRIIPVYTGIGYRFPTADLLLFLGLIAVLTFSGIFRGVVSGLFHQRLLNITETLSITSKLLFTVLFFLLGLRVEGVLLAVVIAYSFPAMVYYRDFKQGFCGKAMNGEEKYRKHASERTEWERVKRYSLIMFLFALAYFVLGNELDVVMLKFISGRREAGYYNIAYRFAFINAMVFIGAIDGVLVPAFASLGEGNPEGKVAQRKALRNALKFTTLFLVPSAAVGVLYSEGIVEVFFGVDYSTSAEILSILYLTLLLSMALSWPLRFLLVTVEREGTVLKIYLFWGILNLTGNFLLIPAYGGVGAAVSTGFAAWGIAIHLLLSARKTGFLELPVRSGLVSVISAIALLVPFYLYLPSPTDIFTLALEYLAFVALYSILVLAMKGVSVSELKKLYRLLRGKE